MKCVTLWRESFFSVSCQWLSFPGPLGPSGICCDARRFPTFAALTGNDIPCRHALYVLEANVRPGPQCSSPSCPGPLGPSGICCDARRFPMFAALTGNDTSLAVMPSTYWRPTLGPYRSARHRHAQDVRSVGHLNPLPRLPTFASLTRNNSDPCPSKGS